MPKSKRARLRQLENWLSARFPPPRKTVVRVCRLERDLYGDTVRLIGGGVIHIRLSDRLPWGIAIHFLFHEWAHAMTWPLAAVEMDGEEHSPEMGVAWASILHAYFDEDGWEESRDYPDN